MGYALIGLAAGTRDGIRGVLIYLVTYVFMNAGTFACIIAMRRRGRALEQISDLSGLGAHRSGAGAGAWRCSCSAWPASRRSPASSASSTSSSPPCRAGYLDAGGDRRADQRGRRLLLPARHQGDVFRRAGGGLRPARRPRSRFVAAAAALFTTLFFVFPAPVLARGAGGGEGAVRVTAGAAALAAAAIRDAAPPPPISASQLARGRRAGAVWPSWRARQTAGRGSRGRTWESPPGNLASLGAAAPGRAARAIAGQWALLAGVALAEALAHVCRRRRSCG